MFLLIYLFDLAFTLQIFSSAAKVNTASRKWIKSCKGKNTKKFQRKIHKSLAPLRLMSGNNFVDVLTPLVGVLVAVLPTPRSAGILRDTDDLLSANNEELDYWFNKL